MRDLLLLHLALSARAQLDFPNFFPDTNPASPPAPPATPPPSPSPSPTPPAPPNTPPPPHCWYRGQLVDASYCVFPPPPLPSPPPPPPPNPSPPPPPEYIFGNCTGANNETDYSNPECLTYDQIPLYYYNLAYCFGVALFVGLFFYFYKQQVDAATRDLNSNLFSDVSSSADQLGKPSMQTLYRGLQSDLTPKLPKPKASRAETLAYAQALKADPKRVAELV